VRRVLVTGIGGFVGPYLLDELTSSGYEVEGLDRVKAPELEGRAQVFEADLTDRAAVRRVIETFRPELVVHLAAISDVALSFREPERVRAVNVGGTENLLQVVQDEGSARRVLVVGSAYEYGIPEALPIDEDHPLRPNNPYAESKVEAERVAFARGGELEVMVARSFNHTGPGQTEEFVLPSFAAQIARIEKGVQEPALAVGDLDVKRDFLDVLDVVRAYRLLLEKGRGGTAYNVSSGVACRIGDLLDRLLELATVAIEVKSAADRLRPVELPVLQGSHARLTEHTGWEPRIDMAETLARLLGHWREVV